jgi:hypothetical protein
MPLKFGPFLDRRWINGDRHAFEVTVAIRDIPDDGPRAGLRRRKPGQTDKVETRIGGVAASLNGETVFVQHRQLHEQEVEGITCCPNDIREVCQLQIQLRNKRSAKAVSQSRQRFFRSDLGPSRSSPGLG